MLVKSDEKIKFPDPDVIIKQSETYKPSNDREVLQSSLSKILIKKEVKKTVKEQRL